MLSEIHLMKNAVSTLSTPEKNIKIVTQPVLHSQKNLILVNLYSILM